MLRRARSWITTLLATSVTLSGAVALSGDAPAPPAVVTPSPGDPPPDAGATPAKVVAKKTTKAAKLPRVVKTDRQWRSTLEVNQYLVARRKATEPAFSGIYWNHHDDGVYACVCCGTPQFDSLAKFDSGTGWPSYWRGIDKDLLKSRPDISNGQPRTEVNCRVCDAHLGHVFNDGPRPTGLRFCINSAALVFVPRADLPEHLKQWREAVGLAPAEPDKDKLAAVPKDADPATAAEAKDAAKTDLAKPAEVGRPLPKPAGAPVPKPAGATTATKPAAPRVGRAGR